MSFMLTFSVSSVNRSSGGPVHKHFPCVIDRPPSWVRGLGIILSTTHSTEGFGQSCVNWVCGAILNTYNINQYLQHKCTKTSVLDTRNAG